MHAVENELRNIETAVKNAREAMAAKAYNSKDVFTEADLSEAIKDNLCPETVAIIAKTLRNAAWGQSTDDETINSQYQWFADLLAELVGGWDLTIETARDYGIE